jgi:hypothetical protein
MNKAANTAGVAIALVIDLVLTHRWNGIMHKEEVSAQ